MANESVTPRSLGYRMPAEWERHAATWLAWPHNAEDWPGRFHPIPWVYCDIIRHLSGVENVHLLVGNAAAEQRARNMLVKTGAQLGRVHFHHPKRITGPRCHHQLALQRLGEVRGLAAR
jgi:agmatine deiminase